jgi:hypothetical protein
MKLRNASRRFDDTIAADAYDTNVTFKCQVEPFDYVKIDGASVKRRVMATAPGIITPARQVIMIEDQPYIIGDSSTDHWKGKPVRNRYVLQGADYLVEVLSIPQLLASQAGTQAYASIEFNKYSTDSRDSSDYMPQYHIFFGNETVPLNSIIKADGRYYLVMNSHRTVAGLIDALSNELDAPVVDSASFKVRTYNPLTDTHTEVATTVRCIKVRWQDHFSYLTQDSTKYVPGDMQIFIPTGVAHKAGDGVTIGATDWTILSTIQENGYQSLHVRRK